MPWSVPATTSVSAKANTRTVRPSRPRTEVHVPPLSRLMSAPDPRVPASTMLGEDGLNASVEIDAFPACTDDHAAPPFVLRKREPCASPAISCWLLNGSTACAKSADRCWLGSVGSATHFESGSAATTIGDAEIATTHKATTVARRRWPNSDTSRPIITSSGDSDQTEAESRDRAFCLQSPGAVPRSTRSEGETAWLVDRQSG